jgi:hypothetical protein
LQPWARAGHHHLEPSSRTHHARADGSEAITWDENISGFPRSGGGTQPYTFGHDAIAREAPERDQQLACQRFYDEPRFPGSGFGSGLVRLVSALNTDLDWLREHTRYLQRATEWGAGGRPANRLLSGPDIATAKAWAERRPKNVPEPTELQLDFIKASEAEQIRQQSAEAQRLQEIAEAQAERGKALAEREAPQAREAEAQKREVEAQRREAEQSRRVAQRTQMGLVGAAVSALILLVLGLVAFHQRNNAIDASQKADEQRKLALTARNEALRTQSRFLADMANRSRSAGDAITATLLSIEALTVQETRTKVAQAEQALYAALQSPRGSLVFRGHHGARPLEVSAPARRQRRSGQRQDDASGEHKLHRGARRIGG